MLDKEFLSMFEAVTAAGRGGYKARCPAHQDENPSLSISAGGDGRVLLHCFAGCTARDICDALGIRQSDLFPSNASRGEPITVEALAAHKKLPAALLRGVFDMQEDDEGRVCIPYFDINGDLAAMRLRTSLSAKEGSRWEQGNRPIPYSLNALDDVRVGGGDLILVEGESDCWTLCHHGHAALGIPGATMAKVLEAEHLSNVKRLYVAHEPDRGGDTFIVGVARRLREIGYAGEAYELRLDGAKDMNEMHCQNPDAFRDKLVEAKAKASILGAPAPATVSADGEMRPVEWLWQGRIPRGMLSILDSDPGLGKSTLLCDLAARLSRGDALPGKDAALTPANSILISFEDTIQHVIRPRLVGAGADRNKVRIWDLHAHPFNLADSLDRLASEIEELGAAWVVIDPLMAAVPTKRNSHSDQDIRTLLSPLSKLAERTNCAITFVRHLNKTKDSKALYRGGGSIGIIAAARAGMLLGLDPHDDTKGETGVRVLAMTKCNVGKPAPSLYLHVVSAPPPAPGINVARIEWGEEAPYRANELVVEASNQDDEALSDTEEWLQTLLAGGPLPTNEIKKQATAAGMKWRTVERAKAKLGALSRRDGYGAGGAWKWELREAKTAARPVSARNGKNGRNGGLSKASHTPPKIHSPSASRHVADNGRIIEVLVTKIPTRP